MKKFIVLLTISLGFVACNNKELQLENAQNLYQQGLSNSDAATTKVALNQLLLLDSTNTVYQDSLSRIYMSSGNFEAGIKYAEKVYNSGKSDIKLKENMAVAYQQLGETEKAEKFIKNLLAETNDYKYLYQQLVIQYEVGNQVMFDSLAKNILERVENDSLVARTVVPMPGPVTGLKQMVPMKAATYFLIGNNALEKRQDINTAISYLQESIKEYNEFEMSRYVLMEIEKMMMSQRQ
ncbi:MAG: hypothetical protein COA58_01945 [Bacteroidetes bacterium]|nr:MAG: hypothetical protein COA58_01945 [Bacteroidota bacterium]